MKLGMKSILMGCCMVQLGLLVGCQSAENNKVAMGRYIEQEVSTGDILGTDLEFVMQKSDGKFEIYSWGQEGLKAYEEQEDASFKEIEVAWADAFSKLCTEDGMYPVTMDLDANNQPYIIATGIFVGEQGEEAVNLFNVDDMRTYLLTPNENQVEMTQLQIEGEQPYIMPSQLEVLPNGDCIVGGGYTGILQFDMETGNLVKTYSADDDGKFFVRDEKLYLASTLNPSIEIYDMNSGQVEKSIPYEGIDGQSQILLQGEQGIYLLNNKGIWHLAEGGEVWEEIMTSAGVSLGLPSYSIESAFFREDEFVVHLVDDTGMSKLKSYIYSETTPSKPEVELTAYILEDSQTIRETLVNYELNHPEVRINVQQGINEESGMTKEDAIKALHTELLAGAGPDILLLDGLDMDAYTEKNLLANLEDIEEMQQVLPQISKAFKKESGTYAIPLRFGAMCIVGDEALLNEVSSIEELVNYQKNHMDAPIMSDMTANALFSSMASIDSASWLTNDGKLNKDCVGSFLEGIHLLANMYDENDTVLEEDDDLMEMLHIATGKTEVQLLEATSIWDILYASDAVSKRGEGSIKMLMQDGKACFRPTQIIGVNQNSKNIERAKDIVGSMLSQENQKVDMNEGFPVAQTALESWLTGEAINQDQVLAVGIPGEDGMTDEYIQAMWENRRLLPIFKEEINKIEMPILGNSTLEEMILEEAMPYFNGEKSLEEVLANLESKVALYQEG